ncbi:hypothetical protein V8D89_012925 [Ganoderma adspersum]
MQNTVSASGYHEGGNAATIHPEETQIAVPLRRLYNLTAYGYFYTTSESKRDSTATNLDPSKEGVTKTIRDESRFHVLSS